MGKTHKISLTSNRFPEIARRLPVATRRIVRETAHDIERRAKLSIQSGAKTGRLYRRGKKFHRASAPGQAPATDTGNLVNSIGVQFTGETRAIVYVGAEYAPHLEYGTARMAARPFMTPAAEAARPRFLGELQNLEREL